MKYTAPALEISIMETEQIIALSRSEEPADPNQEGLVNEKSELEPTSNNIWEKQW